MKHKIDKQKVIRFFNEYATEWDINSLVQPDKINRILDAAGVCAGDKVLDIACGTGIMFPFYLKRAAQRVTGVDIAPEMVRCAKEKYKDNDAVEVICADAEIYPFDGDYDRCVVFNAFPHFADRGALIENLFRALRTGGTLTVAHDNGRKGIDAHHEGAASPISNGLISEDELEKLFVSCGFSHIYKLATDDIYIVSGTKSI